MSRGFFLKRVMQKKYTVILPIHNSAERIFQVVLALLKNTSADSELIFIFDGCTDLSKENANLAIQDFQDSIYSNEKRFVINQVTTQNIFEVRSNNYGSKLANGEYVIFMQDDVVVDEANWNIKLCEPIEKWKDVFAVSGNCAHNWSANQNSAHLNDTIFETRNNVWCDILNHTDHANASTVNDDNFHIRSTCNRAPLAVSKKVFYDLDGLDEIYFPLDMDDHDLMFRARIRFDKVCGYRKIKTISKPEWGGTRNADGSTKDWVFEANQKNTKLFFGRYKNYLKQTIETREL